MIVLLGLSGALLILTEGSALAPLIYALFQGRLRCYATHAMKLEVPYGSSTVGAELPDDRFAGAVHPNEVAAADEAAVLTEALAAPVSSPTLTQFLEGAGAAVVLINDAARPTPTAKVLEHILPQLESVPDLTFLVATGSHKPPTQDEYRRIFGNSYESVRNRVAVHDCRAADDMVLAGTTPRGTEVRLNRLAVDAPKLVVVGSVEPHYFAGYTGGRKAFLPGVSAHRTIEQNHRHALDAASCPLALEGNPVHEDMEDAAGLMGDKPVFAVMTVVDSEHRLHAAAAGDMRSAFRAMVGKARDVYSVEVPEKSAVVVAVATDPFDASLYQAHKAIESGKLVLEDGGVLILVAECRDGVGYEAFVNLMSSAGSPEEVLRRVASDYSLGHHKAANLAALSVRASVSAVTSLPDETIESVFFRPEPSLQQALDGALERTGPDSRALFLMSASTTVPRLPK